MHKIIATLLLLLGISASTADQKAKAVESQSIPIATQTLLDGVKSTESKSAIKSVLMLHCPKDGMKGTGFVLSGGGIITSNSHVVGICSAEELVGISAVSAEPVKFVKMKKDSNRDLALLCPSKPLPFSLELKGDENSPVETEVETWGYPLSYQDPAPILSRGYVAGYTVGKDLNNGQPKNPPVRHLIVNGALHPGNSGGPLIDRTNGKVIGIVVEKWRLFSPDVEAIITGFQHSKTMTGGGFQVTDANGVTKGITNETAVAMALKEIYDDSQVMIGEAISVSELNAFIKEKREALACVSL
jgi:S1-C subfamily serine protease